MEQGAPAFKSERAGSGRFRSWAGAVDAGPAAREGAGPGSMQAVV
jgi:hypothetical protein